MSEARPLILRALRPTTALAVPRRSLTRRAIEQPIPRKTVLDHYLRFRWGRYVWRSLLLMVVAPVMLSAGYHIFVAAPTYKVESRFAVRAAVDRPLVEAYVGQGTFDLLPSPSAARSERNDGESASGGEKSEPSKGTSKSGVGNTMQKGNGASQIAALALGALGNGSGDNEPFIVAEYIKSLDIVEALDKDGWLRARLSHGNADWLQTLRPGASPEELWRYWRHAVTASLDISTYLIHLEVDAFTAEDALAISQAIAAQAEALVNRMAERSRRDRMSGAEAQVKHAQQRYSDAEAALRQFKTDEDLIDPQAQAKGTMKQLLALISARIGLDVRLRMASPGLDKDAPQLRRLREQIAALDAEIKKTKAALADAQGSPDAAVNFLSVFEQKETERQIATMLYEMALSNLEQAKLESERQASYLTVYAPPFLPHHPTAISVVSSVMPTFILSFVLWGIVTLVIASSRDHLR